MNNYRNETIKNKIPLIHITDLYSPPMDPDDHFDLTAVLAIEQFEVRAIILDDVYEQPPKVPGKKTVEKAAGLYNRGKIPCFSGLKKKLASEDDKGLDQPEETQKGIKCIIDILKSCEDGSVVITTVGSLRDICAAYNREPELFCRKIKKLVVNAGDSFGAIGPKDWNTGLDIYAWRKIMTSGLPIDWYPCNPSKGRGGPSPYVTYWNIRQKDMFAESSPEIKEFFNSEGIDTDSPIIRHMWSTVSFIETAGLQCCLHRNVIKWITTDEFKAFSEAKICKIYDMLPVIFELTEDSTAKWRLAEKGEKSTMRIFKVLDNGLYLKSMISFIHKIYQK